MLVTGGAGFIGSNFIRHIQLQDAEVHIVNLDALNYAGSLENLTDIPDPARHRFVQGNICDRPLVDDLLHTHAIDIIVHFAAETHVDRSIIASESFIQTNILGTFSLLESARKYWLDEQSRPPGTVRFHHISTDEVYGTLELGQTPFTEDTPYAPNSPYAASKAASDHLVRAFHKTYGLPVTITNCSNNYGPFQFPEKMIPLMILNAIQGQPLPVYGDGQQIRDWLYVDDHCEAIRLILEHGRLGETYNIGGNNQIPNLELVRLICTMLDALIPDSKYCPHERLIQFVADRPGHDRRYAMDISKIHRDLGWSPRHPLENGIRKTVAWYMEHPEWVKTIMSQPGYQDWIKRNYLTRGKAI